MLKVNQQQCQERLLKERISILNTFSENNVVLMFMEHGSMTGVIGIIG